MTPVTHSVFKRALNYDLNHTFRENLDAMSKLMDDCRAGCGIRSEYGQQRQEAHRYKCCMTVILGARGSGHTLS